MEVGNSLNLDQPESCSHKPLSLRVNFSWTFLGNVVYAGCQWGMLMVLAKLGSPEMVGEFALGLAVTAPVFMFTNLQLRAVQATDAKQEYKFSAYFTLRLITTGIALVVISGIAFFAGYTWELKWIVLAVGASKAIESLSDVMFGFMQQHERMDQIALSMILKGFFSLIGFFLVVNFSKNLFGGMIVVTVIWFLILFFYDKSNAMLISNEELKFFLNPKLNCKILLRLSLISLPLGFVMMLISLNTNIPRYFIEHYLNVRELGFYSAMAYCTVAGGLIVSALGQSACPRLSRYCAQKKLIAFRSLLLKLIFLGAFIGFSGFVISFIAGKQIINLLFTTEYSEYVYILYWLMIAVGFSFIGSFLGYCITATRTFNTFSIPYSILTIIIILLSYILIPNYGLLGAALVQCFVGLGYCIVPLIILVKNKSFRIDYE